MHRPKRFEDSRVQGGAQVSDDGIPPHLHNLVVVHGRGPDFEVGEIRDIFSINNMSPSIASAQYDVSANGNRFLVITTGEGWSSDGREIAYTQGRGAANDAGHSILSKASNGTGQEKRILSGSGRLLLSRNSCGPQFGFQECPNETEWR